LLPSKIFTSLLKKFATSQFRQSEHAPTLTPGLPGYDAVNNPRCWQAIPG
jgi:hypothetical protein